MENTSPEALKILHARDPATVNIIAVVVVLAVLVPTAVACFFEGQTWAVVMVACSYAILIPGLFSRDFSFNIAIVNPVTMFGLLPDRIQITMSEPGVPGPICESTRSVIPLLWRTDARLGAVLLAIFAFVVPLVKLLMIGLAQVYGRHPDNPGHLKIARRSLQFVSLISKWAAPDMFAFILLYYLLRHLHHPPLLESLQLFDVGFVCYTVFCVASVVSTMGLPMPALPDEEKPKPSTTPGPNRYLIVAVMLGMFAAWCAFFVIGLSLPCIYVKLDVGRILASNGLSSSLEPIINDIIYDAGLQELLDSQVSLMHCATALWQWVPQGELTLILAATMLSAFCLIFTALDVAMLLVAAIFWATHVPSTEKSEHEIVKGRSPLQMLVQSSYVCKHLSMLDVCVAGVVLTVLAAEMYRAQGIVIGPKLGLLFLGLSEVTHYGLYYLVTGLAGTVVNVDH